MEACTAEERLRTTATYSLMVLLRAIVCCNEYTVRRIWQRVAHQTKRTFTQIKFLKLHMPCAYANSYTWHSRSSTNMTHLCQFRGMRTECAHHEPWRCSIKPIDNIDLHVCMGVCVYDLSAHHIHAHAFIWMHISDGIQIRMYTYIHTCIYLFPS
jgi:hypothetical protein